MPLAKDKSIPETLLKAEVLDKQGKKIKFEALLEGTGTLVILIRHFACIGCTTQMIAIAPKLLELDKLGIKVKIIGNGDQGYIEGFMDKFRLHNKPVSIYTDPSLKVYSETEMHRTFWRLINPLNLWQYIKAFSKGITQTKVQGDNVQMGGTLLISSDNHVEYYFQNKSITGIADTNNVMNKVHRYLLKHNRNLI